MPSRIRLSEGGKRRTVYVEHGIWREGDSVYIALDVGTGFPTIWDYSEDTDPKLFAIYKKILEENGRWELPGQ